MTYHISTESVITLMYTMIETEIDVSIVDRVFLNPLNKVLKLLILFIYHCNLCFH